MARGNLIGFACGHAGFVDTQSPDRSECLSCSTWRTLKDVLPGWTPEPNWPKWTSGTPPQRVLASDTRAWFVGKMADEQEKYPIGDWFEALGLFTDADKFLDLTPQKKNKHRSYGPLRTAVLSAAGYALPAEELANVELERERELRRSLETQVENLTEENQALKRMVVPLQEEIDRLRASARTNPARIIDDKIVGIVRLAKESPNKNEAAASAHRLVEVLYGRLFPTP